VRENAHDYFLSAKARFQNSGDVEDAAELYFAARNMANHGHDVEWDDILKSARKKLTALTLMNPVNGQPESVLVTEEEAKDIQSAIAVSRLRTPILRRTPVRSKTGRTAGRMRSDVERKAPMISMGPHRSHIVGSDTRRVFVEPICSDFPGGAYEKMVLYREQIPEANREVGGPTSLRPFEGAVQSHKNPLAHANGIDAIREIRASRPRSPEQSGGRDEMAMQNWFIETTLHPRVYDHLLDYYHPDSPFFVGSETHGDRRIDAHSQEIVEKYLPSTSSRVTGENTIRGLFDAGEPIFDLKDSADRERLNHMRDQVGIYGPDMMGQWDLEQRTRLYTSRYNQWLKEYERRFPDSTVSEDDLKKVFLDHLMLDIDGVGQEGLDGWDDEIVWSHLYNQEGEPLHDLPEPNRRNITAGYKSMAHLDDYANMRDRRRAMGLEALRSGLICLGPDTADTLLHAAVQKKWLQSFQATPREVQRFILGPTFNEDMGVTKHHRQNYLTRLVDEDGNERMFDPAYQTFHDGTPAPPILMSAMTRYIQGHRLMMNTAMAKFWTNSTDTPHEADQPVLHPKEANLVKRCLKYTLLNAHRLSIERNWKERLKASDDEREVIDAERNPIYAKVFAQSSQNPDENPEAPPAWDWDPVHDIPKPEDNPLETFHDLNLFLHGLREKGIINGAEYIKMLLYADAKMDGSQAYSFNIGRGERDFSTKRRSQHLRSAAPLVDSVWGVDVDEVTADQLQAEHEATPFAPTHKRLTAHGGLAYHAQDPNCVFGQWRPDEMFPFRKEHLTMGTEHREIPKPGEANYRAFIDGLGYVPEGEEENKIGNEVHLLLTGEYGKDDILRNPQGKLSHAKKWVLDRFPHLGKTTFNESDLASQDANAEGMHRDRRDQRRAWDEISEEDIVRNMVARRERELQTHDPKDPLDTFSAGTAAALLDQHFPDEIAEGSIGFYPAYPTDVQWATTLPPWVASNIALQKYILPVNRTVPTEEEERGRALGDNIEARKTILESLLRYAEYNVPPSRIDPSLAVRPLGKPDENYAYSPKFESYWQGVALNMAAMFYMGRHPTMRNSTLYPLSAARAKVATEHGHKRGNLSDGDGEATSKQEDYSFHHRQLGKSGLLQHEATLKDFEAKHAASLWGLGGTLPISYSDREGDHAGKTVIAGHLDGSMVGYKDAVIPYLDMVRQMHRSRKGAFIDSHYLDHPNIYMPDDGSGQGTNHDLFAMLMARERRGRYGRRYNDEVGSRGAFVDVQPLSLNPHWKDMLESRDVPEFGPHWYKVYQHQGRDALRLTRLGTHPQDARSVDEPVRHIYAPLDYLEKDTIPLEGGWENPLMQSRAGLTTFDMSMLTVGSRVGDEFSPAMAAAEKRGGEGKPYAHDMVSHQYVFVPESGSIPTMKDEQGNEMVLGPHPALLASQWADFAMAQKPSPLMREAMGYVNDMARKSIEHVELPEEDKSDLLYLTGVTPGGHHLTVRNHINVAHALRAAWPIAMAYSALTAVSNDEHFQFLRDRPFSEKVDAYEREYLSIPEGATAAEAAPKRARIYQTLSFAYKFMAGHHEATNERVVRAIHEEIKEENNPDLTKRWNTIWRNAGLSTKDGALQFNYRTHSPVAKYKTEVSTGPSQHPLSAMAATETRDQVLGMDLLNRYLDNEDSEVSRSINRRGFSLEDIRDGLGQLENRFPIGEELRDKGRYERKDNQNKNRKDVANARQHEYGTHYSQWFRGIKRKESRIKPPTKERDMTRYKMILRERARHARRAMDAAGYIEGMSEMDFNNLMNKIGPLLWGDENTRSPLGIIQYDLATKKDKDENHAFSTHHNVLSMKYRGDNRKLRRFYEEEDDLRTKAKVLAEFLFAKGHWANVHSYGKTSKDGSGIENPIIGSHHSQSSTVPDVMDFGKAKLSSFLFNPLTLVQFGLEMPEEMTRNKVVEDERRGPESMGRWPEGVDEGEIAGRQFATFPASSLPQTRYLEFHPDALNGMLGYQLDNSDGNNFEQPPAAQSIASGDDRVITSMDSLTDTDLLLKSEKGEPVPVKAMHRIFKLDDLEYFKGLSGDWVVSSWPIGERLMVTRKSNLVKAKDSYNEDYTLSNEVKKDVRAAHDSNFVIDCIWDGDVLHIVDIVKAGDEDMENEHTKHRIRHLRANFSATDNVSIPAPVNTKRVDSEGLNRAVKDLFKERGVKQVMLRDADSTYMKGETRHPKWLLMTKEKQVDVIVLESGGATTLLGIGPLVDEDAKKMGNRAVKYQGDYYMDVGSITKSGLQQGMFITVKTSNVVCKSRNGLMIFTLHGAKYVRDAESQAGDSLKTLELLSGENSENVPHKLRVSKGSVHLEFPIGHVVYDTEPHGHSFIVKSVDAPSPYMATLAESQREYWEPLAAVFLRAEVEAKKAKKANVVPEPPANHDKKPKKVLKPSERLLKDPKLLKQVMTVLETAENLLKEKVTFTGPKGLGIDFATPVESPSGPTDNTEPYNLPDHDPAHRQEKGGDCWCGAKKGQMCEQGTGVKIDVCPRFSPPKKEKKKKHIKIDVS